MKELLNNGSEYHLWFVYSILFIYLLVPFLRKMVKACSEKQLWILFAIAVFQTTIRPFVNLFLRGVGVSVYFTADGFSGYIGYVLLGYILGTYCERRLTCGVIYTAGALFFIITPIVSMHSAVNGGEMYLSGGYSVNHYVEAAAIFLLCKNTVKSTSRVFSALSSVSFSAYLIHVFIIEGMRQVEFYVVPWVLLTIYVCVSVPLSFLWGGLVKLAASLASKTRQMIKNNKPERRKNDNG